MQQYLSSRHPAMSFDLKDLLEGLEAARAAGHVYRRDDTSTSRSLYCYTSRCVYEAAWSDVTVLARGLVVDRQAGRLVATPFPKFRAGPGNLDGRISGFSA